MPGGILLTKEGELHARRKRPNGRIDPQGRNMGELVARLHAPAGSVLRRTDPAFFDPRPPPPDYRHHTEDRELSPEHGHPVRGELRACRVESSRPREQL